MYTEEKDDEKKLDDMVKQSGKKSYLVNPDYPYRAEVILGIWEKTLQHNETNQLRYFLSTNKREDSLFDQIHGGLNLKESAGLLIKESGKL